MPFFSVFFFFFENEKGFFLEVFEVFLLLSLPISISLSQPSPSPFLFFTSDAKVERELGKVVPDPRDGDAREAGPVFHFRFFFRFGKRRKKRGGGEALLMREVFFGFACACWWRSFLSPSLRSLFLFLSLSREKERCRRLFLLPPPVVVLKRKKERRKTTPPPPP